MDSVTTYLSASMQPLKISMLTCHLTHSRYSQRANPKIIDFLVDLRTITVTVTATTRDRESATTTQTSKTTSNENDVDTIPQLVF